MFYVSDSLSTRSINSSTCKPVNLQAWKPVKHIMCIMLSCVSLLTHDISFGSAESLAVSFRNVFPSFIEKLINFRIASPKIVANQRGIQIVLFADQSVFGCNEISFKINKLLFFILSL